MSVILTNELIKSPAIPGAWNGEREPITEAGLAIAGQQDPAVASSSRSTRRSWSAAWSSWRTPRLPFWVGFVLIL